jgi:hypothetical protein
MNGADSSALTNLEHTMRLILSALFGAPSLTAEGMLPAAERDVNQQRLRAAGRVSGTGKLTDSDLNQWVRMGTVG